MEALHALDSRQALFQFVGALLRHSDIQSDRTLPFGHLRHIFAAEAQFLNASDDFILNA